MVPRIRGDHPNLVPPLVAVVLAALAAADAFAGPPFAGPVIPTHGGGPWAVTATDLDGDGREELAVTLLYSDEVLVLGAPGLDEAPAGRRYPVGGRPISLAAGDLDGDGRKDLAVLNSGSADISVLFGRQGGGFEPERRVAFPEGEEDARFEWGMTHGLAVADLNRDGIDDIAVVNGVDISLLMGSREGGFAAGGRVAAGVRPFSLVAADFDANGTIDVAATNISSDDVSLAWGRGDGTFDPGPPISIGLVPRGLATADLNGDGALDLVTASLIYNPLGDRSGDVSVRLGTGDGDFLPVVRYPAGEATMSVAMGDFNHDGRPDIAAGNPASGDASVLLGAGDGTFEAERRVRTGKIPIDLALLDGDGDGHLDLVQSISADGISLVRGLGDGTFGPQAILGIIVSPASVAAADFDGDGVQDLIAAGRARSIEPGNVALLAGRGDGGFDDARTLAIGDVLVRLADVEPADFNGDGRMDFAVADGVRSVGVVPGGVGWAFGPVSWIETGWDPSALAAADFNGDGRPDLAVTHDSSDGVLILLGRGDGGFEPGDRLPASYGYLDAVTADFDADGVVDLAAVGEVLDPGLEIRPVAMVWKGIGDGRFQEPLRLDVADRPFAVTTGDLDNDGLVDLLVAGEWEITVLRNRGRAGFASGVRYPGPYLMSDITVADFTRDGILDVAVLSFGLELVSVFPGSGDGTLGRERRSIGGRQPLAFAAGDFDGNGAADLVLADLGLRNAWHGSDPELYVMLNQAAVSNRAPTAVVVAPTEAECSSREGATVLLDGTASRDPDSRPGGPDDLAAFDWYENHGTPAEFHLGSGPALEVTLGLGRHDILLRVTDRAGAHDDAETTIAVVDTVPPALELRPLGPTILWPPDHRMVDFTVEGVAADRCGPVRVILESVASSEADDAPGSGDGNTAGDVRGAEIGRPDFRFQLRAERSGSGTGRTYAATYRATDASGIPADAVIKVVVPVHLTSPTSAAPARE